MQNKHQPPLYSGQIIQIQIKLHQYFKTYQLLWSLLQYKIFYLIKNFTFLTSTKLSNTLSLVAIAFDDRPRNANVNDTPIEHHVCHC